MLKAGLHVPDTEYMSPAMKDSLSYVKSGLEPVKELEYSTSTMTQEDVVQKEPFKLSVND
eukprot:563531-Ditylum_brightwellii.AAC.1